MATSSKEVSVFVPERKHNRVRKRYAYVLVSILFRLLLDKGNDHFALAIGDTVVFSLAMFCGGKYEIRYDIRFI